MKLMVAVVGKGNRFSNAKLRALGFSPVVPTEEGLRRTFEELREKKKAV